MRRSEEGPEGRYVARWVPEHPGLHFAMTRANGKILFRFILYFFIFNFQFLHLFV